MRPIRPAVAATVVTLILAGAAGAQSAPTPVYLEPVEKRAVRRSAELVGTAEARRYSVVSAEVAGRVVAMLADAGDYVKAGQPVCRMRRLPVELQLKRAQGLLAAAAADLRKKETGYRPEEIAQAEARVNAARAGYERWKLEYARTRKLLADGASTPAEMESTEASFRQAREMLAEAEANLRLQKSGFRTEDIDAARAQVATQTAAVEELKDTLAKMTVAMPFDGFIVKKACEVGEWLSPGTAVVEAMDLSVVRVQLDVPERYFGGLEKGAPAPVTFEALGSDRQVTGTVSQIVPSSAEGTHTITVRVDVPNTVEDGRPQLAAGLLARVWLPVGKTHEALLVPKAAVVRQGGRDVVYTVSDTPPAGDQPAAAETRDPPPADGPPPKYAVQVPVRIIQGYGRYMEVEGDGLKVGMPVVTRGTYLMAPGSPVVEVPKERGAPASGAAGAAGGCGFRVDFKGCHFDRASASAGASGEIRLSGRPRTENGEIPRHAALARNDTTLDRYAGGGG